MKRRKKNRHTTCSACHKRFYYNREDTTFKPELCAHCILVGWKALECLEIDPDEFAKQVRGQ